MFDLESQIHAAGYVRCANVDGRWYTGASGIPSVPDYAHNVMVTDDRIRVYVERFFGEPYTRRSWRDTVTVAVFETVPAFLDWCREHGRPSEPGQSAFSQGAFCD